MAFGNHAIPFPTRMGRALLRLLLLLPWVCGDPAAGAASWEGSVAVGVGWEAGVGPGRSLELAAEGPVGAGEWRLEGDMLLGLDEQGGPVSSLPPLEEGRLALAAPAFRLQLLLDRPHLATRDPLALVSGSRRGQGQPALTLEAAGRSWDLTAQVARRIDNPGPDGDLATLRLQGWWPGRRAALTLIHLEEGMLPWQAPEGSEPGEGQLLQRMASLEGYLEVGSVEVGLQAARAQAAGPEGFPRGGGWTPGAGLLRLRTLPWRPSAPRRLEVGLFRTGPGFRSLAARDAPFPLEAAGAWVEGHWRLAGGRRLETELLHARLDQGGVEAKGALRYRVNRWGLGWTAGVEGEAGRDPGRQASEAEARLAVQRSGRWELEVRAGSGTPRLVLWVRPGSGFQARAGWDGEAGGTYRLELRQEASGGSWRLIWKARRQREPGGHLYLEAEQSLGQGWFWGVEVGRWDRGRYDAVWGWPRGMSFHLGRRF